MFIDGMFIRMLDSGPMLAAGEEKRAALGGAS